MDIVSPSMSAEQKGNIGHFRPDQSERPKLCLIKPSVSSPQEEQHQIDALESYRQDFTEYWTPLVVTYIRSRVKMGDSHLKIANDFLDKFKELKEGHAEPDKDLTRDTLVVRSTTLKSLIDFARVRLAAAIVDAKTGQDADARRKADRNVFSWRQVNNILETTLTLNPDPITLTTQPLTTGQGLYLKVLDKLER
ncbi:MAG: hypothetical protein ACD_57C00321G0006 [uncultured bacterium]|nr:MAG: hypothetical protein ACD_57C00321G0006 [uncultured bacterium]